MIFHLKNAIDMNRKRISDALGVICILAIFAGCVEGLDGGLTAWNLGCLAVAGLSGWLSKRMEAAE